MELIFLGKGSGFYPTYDNTSAYFIEDKSLYLIDCGETVFKKIYELDQKKLFDHIYVLITHLHADHVGSLATMVSYFYFVKNIKVNIVHPNKNIIEILRLEGVPGNIYSHYLDLPENKYGLVAKAIEVKHARDMKCYGYLLRDKKEKIFYSGDSADIPDLVLSKLLNGEIDRIYQDTSTYNVEDGSHCFYGVLEKKIPLHKRNRVYCMHLDSPCEDLLKSKGFRVVEVI